MMEIKIKKWIIFTEGGVMAIPYILDLSNENVNDDEIAWCIQEQVYKKKTEGWRIKNE